MEPTNCDRGQILVVEVTCAPQPEPTGELPLHKWQSEVACGDVRTADVAQAWTLYHFTRAALLAPCNHAASL